MTDLLELKESLRGLPKASRQSLVLAAEDLAAGYQRMRTNAPRRMQAYLSPTRSGVTSSTGSSNRIEEHLAAGLFLRRDLVLPNGERLRLLDYQFPLKSVQADKNVGKIDLLGLCADGTIAVIELKVEDNREDRRIALLEGLIYAAIVEANLDPIAREVLATHSRHVAPARPKIFLVAPEAYWTNPKTFPSAGDMRKLAGETARAISGDIALLSLCDANLVELSLDGRPPRVQGHVFLRSIDGTADQTAPSRPASQTKYLANLVQTFWDYRHTSFAAEDAIFDPSYVEGKRPPVFLAAHSDRNLLLPPDASPAVRAAITGMVRPNERHRAFASMRSSQALAQSVFAGLAALGRLEALENLRAEDGYPAFFDQAYGHEMKLEHAATALGEPRPTSVDAFFAGPTRVAVEVKLTEPEFGCCSRPSLKPDDSNFERDHCDGSYSIQRRRATRCALSDIGVKYWQFVPQILTWTALEDHTPCPLNFTYQLVRNVLAAAVSDGGDLELERAHALVIYDARNPAFAPGGAADAQWWLTVRALRYPRLLRRVSWQDFAAHLAKFPDLDWLTNGLNAKYGIQPAATSHH